MIHVEYEKKNNYPHDRELILFDRSAFQSLRDDEILKVNENFNILCPQVFVMECIAPREPFRRQSLCRKLRLIENPIVLTGDTHISPVIEIPVGAEYSGILSSEEIARNCITSTPITMERVAPEKLISHYEPRIGAFRKLVRTVTDACEANKGRLTSRHLASTAQEVLEEIHNMDVSVEEVREMIRGNERTHVTQQLSYVARETLTEMENETVDQYVEGLKVFLYLNEKDTQILLDRIEEGDRRRLTVENFPNLAYPIYVYYLMHYIIYARQHNTEHLDQSYVCDFKYLHYLNFCDRFITNETSTPFIVNSLPYKDISETPISSLVELKED